MGDPLKFRVIGAGCRKGNVVARVLDKVTAGTVEGFLRETVSTKCSLLSTDTALLYRHFSDEFKHGMVDHSKAPVRCRRASHQHH
jgi:hypothetical protein